MRTESQGAGARRPARELAPGTLNRRQAALLERVEAIYREAGCSPSGVEDVARALHVPSQAVAGLLEIGAARGTFVRIGERLWFHAGVVARARDLVCEIAARDGSVSVGAFRDATGSSRKYVVPLLEHFDATGLTRREGDVRVLGDVREPPA